MVLEMALAGFDPVLFFRYSLRQAHQEGAAWSMAQGVGQVIDQAEIAAAQRKGLEVGPLAVGLERARGAPGRWRGSRASPDTSSFPNSARKDEATLADLTASVEIAASYPGTAFHAHLTLPRTPYLGI